MLQFIDDLKSSGASAENIFLKSLAYIQKNFRYLSNHPATDFVRPTDPNLTAHRSYGDCKDFVYVLHTMMELFEIKTTPVLVSTKFGKGLRNMLPAPQLFDHVIILVKIEDKEYFVDPTIPQNVEALKYSYIPDYGFGLLCKSISTELVEVKCKNLELFHSTIVDDYQLVTPGINEFILTSEVINRGANALKIIQYRENQSETSFWEYIKSFYSKFMNVLEVLNTTIEFSDIGKNEVRFRVQYRVALKYFQKVKSQYAYEIAPLMMIDNICYAFPQNLKSDCYIGEVTSMDCTITVNDKKIRAQKQSLVTEIKSSAFKFLKKSFLKKKQVVFKYRLERLQDVVLNNDYADFYEKHQQLMKKLGDSIRCSAKWLSPGNYWLIFLFLYVLIIGLNNKFGSQETNSSVVQSASAPVTIVSTPMFANAVDSKKMFVQ